MTPYTDCSIMQQLLNKTNCLKFIKVISYIVIVLLPFFGFITVWPASIFGHYTLIRLWPEYLVLIIGLMTIILAFVETKVAKAILLNKLVWLIGAYVVLDLIMAVVATLNKQVSSKALAYGILDDLRFFVFFLVCWFSASFYRLLDHTWQKLIFIPAIIVTIFGLMEMFVLPFNFLSHFGYSLKTIPPYETINSNIYYIRIISTLRGANPLGAYLIIPIAAILTSIVLRPKKWLYAKLGLLIALLVVLYGSYSRAAWIGAILTCLVIVALQLDIRQLFMKHKTVLISSLVVIVLLIGGGGLLLQHSHKFQNIIFHTQSNSKAPVSSDQAHLSALANGFRALIKHPLGRGPGSSGPASFYNHDSSVRIPEDYYLEIGEESGLLGFIIFILINVYLGYELWLRRQSPLAVMLLSALVGLTFVNLLSLAWTDDTLSYLYWGLAGLVMAYRFKNSPNKLDKRTLKT